jgi:uncharacterized protein YndB with AHSA1/START domain
VTGSRAVASSGTPAVRVTATALIRAPRERVWAVLTDFSQMHRWFLGLNAVRLEGPPRVGARRVVTFVGGLSHVETITTWAPPARLSLVANGSSGPIAAGASVNIVLSEDGPAVRLGWSIEHRLAVGRLLSAITRPVARGLVGAALRVSLSRLKRRAESAA